MQGQGDVIAIFPELRGARVDYCMSYQHIGQHGDCQPDYIINVSQLASKKEYKPLYDELLSIGYNLQVMKRYSFKMYLNRKLS